MILSLSGVRKSYTNTEGTIEILKGIDLDIAASESVALTGKSGSGKSTLLHRHVRAWVLLFLRNQPLG